MATTLVGGFAQQVRAMAINKAREEGEEEEEEEEEEKDKKRRKIQQAALYGATIQHRVYQIFSLKIILFSVTELSS